MAAYICVKCGCIDNTACGGNYWVKEFKPYKDEYANTYSLCTACTPSELADGSIDEDAGKWHNIFAKKHWTEFGTKEQIIAICDEGNGNFVNAYEYFKMKYKD